MTNKEKNRAVEPIDPIKKDLIEALDEFRKCRDKRISLKIAYELANEKYQEANLLLSEFFEYSTDRIDEGLFLQGQIYEAESPVKDIKKSIENYEALIKNYPSSEYWNDANKRIKYLRRFYYLSN